MMALKVRMLMRRLLAAAVIAVAVLGLIYADHPAQSGLRNATVLIIRHAEKPQVQERLLLGNAGTAARESGLSEKLPANVYAAFSINFPSQLRQCPASKAEAAPFS
ncbi:MULTISPECIES: hypothetical protein [Pseudomonas]|uniref:Histidine phosphatase family protein n=1 Tax=Pseudomonas fluorescens (strain Pf0-1) TaxID=205922 RepID=Q3K4W7_PSEPF|nr:MULTISPECIES: hypothetical protein [Pseudomonas]ABA77187.1 hypothetical protein Pfl01_5450 [Pseudomonas fluorescens Pf0-1]